MTAPVEYFNRHFHTLKNTHGRAHFSVYNAKVLGKLSSLKTESDKGKERLRLAEELFKTMQFLDSFKDQEAILRADWQVRFPHILGVQGGSRKKIGFVRLLQHLQYSDIVSEDIDLVFSLLYGQPVYGDMVGSRGIFRQITEVPSSSASEPICKPRVKPPSFNNPYVLFRTWTKFHERMLKIQAKELRQEEFKSSVYMFGSEWGKVERRVMYNGQEYDHYTKVRQIADFRIFNRFTEMGEALHLYSHQAIIALINSLVAGKLQQYPRQGKKDVVLDLDNQFRKENNEESFSDPSDLDDFIRKTSKLAPVMDQKRHFGDEPEQIDIQGSVQPRLGKLDFSGWCYQWAVRNASSNRLSCFSPNDRRYRHFASPNSEFGSLWSIFHAVRVGEALAFIMNRLFHIVLVIYIDDTVIISDENMLEIHMLVVESLYVFLGFNMSSDKKESHIISKTLQVLGLSYTICDYDIRIHAEMDRITKAVSSLQELKSEITNAKASFKRIEKACGSLIWITHISDSPHIMGYIVKLWSLSNPAIFWTTVKKQKRRRS